ncbi:hypothetical protein SAMD00079811_23410 [Scytonema sp. HK-05]|uniref:hypothetical protein n=1 Tax=Scytonema sp. HK-05 TaxID=1137095 RepID=UPI00095A0402|nr:hypothetical protein [Scytonema sp. HK-05]OKH60462.1 hypothetical protein NIES2130_03440 [Scytonema sp. HK-05]BAY44739.1 hypothetical protein SAMD00079811_23410 [Scytonema sp. HK-05]
MSAIHQEIKTTDGHRWTQINLYFIQTRSAIELAVLSTRSHGWLDIAARVFTYELREENWRVFKFDGKNYKLTEEKLSSKPQNIILSKNSPEFDLGELR